AMGPDTWTVGRELARKRMLSQGSTDVGPRLQRRTFPGALPTYQRRSPCLVRTEMFSCAMNLLEQFQMASPVPDKRSGLRKRISKYCIRKKEKEHMKGC